MSISPQSSRELKLENMTDTLSSLSLFLRTFSAIYLSESSSVFKRADFTDFTDCRLFDSFGFTGSAFDISVSGISATTV